MNQNGERTPKLFTLRAMASRLRVSQTWLREQADTGKVPAVSTGDGYLFSLVPTVKAVGKMAESAIQTATDLQAQRSSQEDSQDA